MLVFGSTEKGQKNTEEPCEGIFAYGYVYSRAHSIVFIFFLEGVVSLTQAWTWFPFITKVIVLDVEALKLKGMYKGYPFVFLLIKPSSNP